MAADTGLNLALPWPRSQLEQQSRTAAACATPHTAVGSSQAVPELGLKQVSNRFKARWCRDD